MKITLCFIGKDNEEDVAQLLESVANHVDAWVYVDTGSTDKTIEIVKEKAEKFNVELVLGTFEWVNDFSAARNFSFSLAPADTDWLLWLDTDDVLANGAAIRNVLTSAPPSVGGITLPYEYGYDEHGNCTSLYYRERLLKKSVGWNWQGACHEVAHPLIGTSWARNEFIVVQHKAIGKRESSIDRNRVLLLTAWDKDPTDARSALYLAFNYFASKEWEEANQWFDRYFLLVGPNPEAWQAFIYKSASLVNLHQYDRAKAHLMQAMVLQPMWKDHYFLLSQIACYEGDWETCIWWDELGRKGLEPLRVLFINPLLYGWGADQYLHLALYNLGRIAEAHDVTERMLKVRPDDKEIKQIHEGYSEFLRQSRRAETMADFMAACNDKEAIAVAPHVPQNLLAIPRLKEAMRGPVFRDWTEREGKRRIAILCPQVFEPWGPKNLATGGIGGSETAVIHVAKNLALLGHHVTVFNDPGINEGVRDGVGYFPMSLYTGLEEFDLVVAWRFPTLGEKRPVGIKQLWLWAHDLHFRDRLTETNAKGFDRIMPVSKWHAGYMKRMYPFLGSNLVPTSNGVDPLRFTPDETIVRDPKRCIYLSSPDRGLSSLFAVWQYLSTIEGTSLHVYYGTENLQKMAVNGDTWATAQLIEIEHGIKNGRNIVSHGRVDQNTLAREIMQSGLWLYPTGFLEVSCISAMEAMAGGLAAVTTELGALPETMGEWGIKVPGWSTSTPYLKQFVGHAATLLQDSAWRDEVAAKGRRDPPTWMDVAKEWDTWLR